LQDQPTRRSRLWLYAPFALLALIVAAWSVGWFVIRGRVAGELDSWLAAEAAAGRNWTCPDRAVAGYPFRIEISCASLSFARADTQASVGRLLVVAQVYDPSRAIAEVSGPLRVTAGTTAIEAQWRLLRASVHLAGGRPQRGDLVAEKPAITVAPAGLAPLALTGERLETHLRPSPTEPNTADWALTATGSVIPGLDGLIGGTEPADIDLVLAVTHVGELPPRPLLAELESWRAADGRINVSKLAVAKGPRRVQASGFIAIDELHRPQGQSIAAVANVEGLLGRFVGGKGGGAAGLLGMLLGGRPQPAPEAPAGADPSLTPVPPVKVANGRVFVGPLQIPGLRIDPLY
jgi:hypothetical protein